MIPVLRAMPYFSIPTSIVGPGVHERASGFQIIVWVSITPIDQLVCESGTPRFPAILDSGFSDTVLISPVQLRSWAKLDWRSLPLRGISRRFEGIEVPVRCVNLWIHPNQYGWRDLFDPVQSAFRIQLNDGIIVMGNQEQVGPDPQTARLSAKRLPLLGLRALTEADAQLRIDAALRQVWLDLPPE
jgi:hypothetical protein